ATLRLYTQIQQVRFGERLRLFWDVDEDVLEAAVPHMLLQPLVENAIKHGVEAHSNAGKVQITARRDGDTLRLSIQDDGPGYRAPSPRRGAGIGIANVKSRLFQIYNHEQSFAVAEASGGGTIVTISIPFMRIDDRGSAGPMDPELTAVVAHARSVDRQRASMS